MTLFASANASNLVNLRGSSAAASDREALVPSYSDFILKLTAGVLRAQPELNSHWSDDRIVVLPEIHMALAVDTPTGLLAPVVCAVDQISLGQSPRGRGS